MSIKLPDNQQYCKLVPENSNTFRGDFVLQLLEIFPGVISSQSPLQRSGRGLRKRQTTWDWSRGKLISRRIYLRLDFGGPPNEQISSPALQNLINLYWEELTGFSPAPHFYFKAIFLGQLLGGGKASWMHISRTRKGVGTSSYLGPAWCQLVFMAFWWPLPIGGIHNDEVQGSPPQEVLLWHVDYFELKARKAKYTQKETLNFPLVV